MNIDFRYFRKNQAIIDRIEWAEKYYTNLKILTPVFAVDPDEINMSIVKGDYPIDEKFTATIGLGISYEDYEDETQYEMILAGYDGIRYKKFKYNYRPNQHEMLGKRIMDVEFIGDTCLSKYYDSESAITHEYLTSVCGR